MPSGKFSYSFRPRYKGTWHFRGDILRRRGFGDDVQGLEERDKSRSREVTAWAISPKCKRNC